MAVQNEEVEYITAKVPNEEVEYITAKVSVWWDLENWDAYDQNFDFGNAKANICSALLNMNYRGTVSISCYGDTSKISETLLMAISSTGIPIYEVDADMKTVCIIVDMLDWAIDNPAPANYFLISNDDELTYTINSLRSRGNNILLALSEKKAYEKSLLLAPKSVWLCNSLFTGGYPIFKRELLRPTRTEQQVGTSSDSEDDSDSQAASDSEILAASAPSVCLGR